AVGEVAAVVAHEVRNPLAVLFNVVSQLRHQLAPQQPGRALRSEEHTSELQSRDNIVRRLLLAKTQRSIARPTQPAAWARLATLLMSSVRPLDPPSTTLQAEEIAASPPTAPHPLSLHDALPIWRWGRWPRWWPTGCATPSRCSSMS